MQASAFRCASLFDGKDLSHWKDAHGGPAQWTVRDGYFEVAPKTGDIYTREEFGDIQLHVEWRTPAPLKPGNVWQGNSGVFLFGVYELQVFESSRNLIYADGQAGAIYGQYPPLVNPSCDPGEWQVYDIIFNPARFKNGNLETPAYITVFQNGVVIQNHTAIMGETGHRIFPRYTDRGPKGPAPPPGSRRLGALSKYLGPGFEGARLIECGTRASGHVTRDSGFGLRDPGLGVRP